MDEPAASSGPKHSKRVIALAAVLFLAGELAVGLALDRAPLHVRFHEASAGLARARAAGPTPDVLLFGSSRFHEGILTERVEQRLRERLGERAPRVTSLAFNGGDLVGTDIMFELVLAQGTRPRIAVIEVTPEWMREPVPFLNAQLLRAFTWRDVADWLPDLLRGTKRTLICARIFPVYCFRNELLTWTTGRPPPYLAAPASPKQAPPRKKPDDPTHGASRWSRRMRDYRVSEHAVAVLERILDRCRDAQIECVLVEPPITTTQRAIIAGRMDTAFRETLARVRAKHPIPFLDFSDRLPDDGFRDSSHGNHSGGERFSVIVADEVIEPRWLAR
jgi:hypothetical protein